MDLATYLIVGSYLFGAASWGMLYREIKALKGEIVTLRLQLAKDQGLEEGRDHERRLTRLERLVGR